MTGDFFRAAKVVGCAVAFVGLAACGGESGAQHANTKTYTITGGGMAPTLRGCSSNCSGNFPPNDKVLVDFDSYQHRALRRQDIIVFADARGLKDFDGYLSVMPNEKVIKRVVGLGGDVLGLGADGRLAVNGVPVDRLYRNSVCPTEYRLSHAEHGSVTKVTVPAGHIFVLGDNSCDSFDSRFYGSVPAADVQARIVGIVFPKIRKRTFS